MQQSYLENILLDQSKDLIWIVSCELQLIYANESYLKRTREMTGLEMKLDISFVLQGFDEAYVERWKLYYKRALAGENFVIEEQFYYPEAKEFQNGQITFQPLINENQEIFAVSCQSKHCTTAVDRSFEASTMIDASLDVFCTIDEQGHFVYVSAASLQLWGYLPQELEGKLYQDFIVEEDVSKSKEVANAIHSGQEIKSFSNRYKRKDGSIAYNLWSLTWDDVSKLYYCVARDAKEIIEQEEKLAQREQRFKALVQEGSDLIAILDAEGNYIYVSPTSISVLGIAPEIFLGKSAFEFIHPSDLERALACLQKMGTENMIIMERYRFQNHKKEWRWLETVLTNMLDNPAVKGIVANSRDITDKIKEEHKLKLFENVITNTRDAVLITQAEPFDEPGNRIVFVNEAFTKMTGYTAEEVIGKSPRFLQGPNSNKKELAKLSRSIRNWKTCEITTINYKKNGEEFWINFTVTPVANENGCYTHWVAIERDVTEQKIKELENELLAQISINFNSEVDLISAANGLCKSVCKYGNFDLVELWTSNLEKSEMQLFSHYVSNTEDEKLYNFIPNITKLRLSEGLAGMVWTEKKQNLWNDIESKDNTDFVRREAMRSIGLKSVLGIPLMHNKEVVGVLKIGIKDVSNSLKKYTRIFQQMEGYIGSELNRKKLENDLTHLFDAIRDILCLTDFNGRFLKINKAGCELLGYTEDEILYHSFDEFAHSKDKKLSIHKLLRSGKLKNTFKFENRLLTKTGKVIWLSWSVTADPEQGIVYCVAKNITEEKKLRELNNEVGKLAKIGSWEMNLGTQTLFWSDEVHKLHETKPKLFVPTVDTAIAFYRKDFQQLVNLSFQNCISTQQPFDFEAVLVTSNNKEVWVRSTGNSEVEDGQCKRVYGSFQDIDERKKAEIKLAESENRFRTILEAEPECIKLLGSNGEILMINPAGLAIIEADSEQEALGKNANEIILPKHRLPFARLTKNVFKGNSGKLVFEIQGLKGTTRWLEIHAVPMKNEQGDIISMLGVSRDITDRKNAEENLRYSEEKNRLIMNAALDAIVSIDLDGNVIFWNAQAEKIFGWSREEVMGKKVSEYIIPEHYRTMHDNGMNHYLNTGEAKMFNNIVELEAVNKNGKIFPIELTVLPIKQGNEEFFCAFLRDISQRKNAEQEKNSLLATLENSLNEIYICDSESLKFTYVNKGALLNLGYSEKEVMELTPLDLKPEFSIKAYKKLIFPLINGNKEKITFFTRHQRKDGSQYPVEVHLQLVTENNNKRFLAVILDITNRKKAEERIIKANERFEKVTEATNDAIWDWDIVKQTYYRSKAIERFFGKQSLKTFRESDFWQDKFHPDDVLTVKKSLSDAISNPLASRWESEYRVFNEHGKTLYVVDRAVIIRNKKGEAIRMVGAMTDISEQKQADQENSFKANLLSMIGQATIATNIDGVINYWNKAAEKIYGWTAEEATGMNIIDATTPEVNREQAMQIMQVLKEGQTWSGEFNVRNKNGDSFPALITNTAIYDENNVMSGIIGISTDITQEVKNEELLKQYTIELERSNEELEQFAFVASHDLQEPLRMISSFMDLLHRKYGDKLDEKGHQYIYFATDGAKRMKHIILDLLDYSRAKKPAEGKEAVDMNEVLSEFKQLRRKLISEKNALIKSSCLPTITTYKAAVTQILHCLIDNSLKYTAEGKVPIVAISARENDKEWEFSIKDNGIGIDAVFYDKIFVIFQRLHNRDKYDGTGIGLSIAKRHVQFIGGRIWLESILGEGTVFYFTIPKN